MNIDKVPTGNQVPNDIYVIIEISSNKSPVKYEMNKNIGILFVDRFIHASMFYPCNYGYINYTLSLDGDPLDVLVITSYPLEVYSVICCRPVGMLKMIDESGEDYKLIAVPHDSLSIEYSHIQDIDNIPYILRQQIIHFFKHYKDLEKNKWVKIIGWDNVEQAKEEILIAIKRYSDKNNK